MEVGETWNESVAYRDPLTGRRVRRLTTRGRVNQTPTYHTNSGFTRDGRRLVLVSVREKATWVLLADVQSGQLKAVYRAPGIGDRSYIHRRMALDFPDVDGGGICGNRLCIAPGLQMAVFACGQQLLAVDVDTLESRTLIEDCGEEWIFGAPCVSPDERHVAITLSSAHPEILDGRRPTKRYLDFPDHCLRIVRVPMAGGAAEVLYERSPAQSAHSAWRPTDASILYFDLDLPPRYWCGSDGATPRIWLLDVATGGARPLKERYPGAFQVHQAWLWDGTAMAYHGPLADGGVYVGIADVDGSTRWEREFPGATHYGHLTPDARRPALIMDGDFSRDRLQWLYYDEEEPRAGPRLEPVCLHSTQWGSIPGQYSHPHPLTDSSGRWISFTSARDGRSDVYVVEIE